MSFSTFQTNLNLIQNFAYKLNNEDIPFQGKKILLQNYAKYLQLNLTESMVEEVLSKIHRRLN